MNPTLKVETRTVILKWHPLKIYRGRVGCWHAYFEGHAEVWEAGANKIEATAKLRVSTKYEGEIKEL